MRLAHSTVLLAMVAQAAQAQGPVATTLFNEQFLDVGGGQATADLSVFAFGNRVLPGTYMVDVSLNENGLGQSEIRFVEKSGAQDAVPCLTRALLEGWGVNVAAFPGLAALADHACADLAAAIPESSVSYDGGKQHMSLSIPQAALRRSARGAVSKDRWDRGITAGMLDYQLSFSRDNGSHYRNDTPSQAQSENTLNGNPAILPNRPGSYTVFAGLRGGFNVGDWRFRHFSTYNRGMDGQGHWQAVNTYAQRDLASINGQLLIGDGTTPGNFFDSMQFRGVQVASDDAMLPDSMQGYAPTIRGVAQTNARVEVRQNGYLIYSTYVAPGPFVLDDLYPTASNGDLEVTITEADGRQTRYLQAFSAVPTLLREGSWRYNATAGKYRNGYGGNGTGTGPFFMQGTLARGVGDEFTMYGGATIANMYQSALVGIGKNLRDFGGVSFDVSYARTAGINGRGTCNGQSLRFLYAKSFVSTGTNFQVAGYRYSTSGYYTFQEAAQMREIQDDQFLYNRRNQVRLELSQQLGGWGTINVSASQQSYWGTDSRDRLVQVGYSGSYRQLSYNIFYNYSTNLNYRANRQLALTLSIPLGGTRANAQYGVTSDNNGQVTQQASVFGSGFDDNRLTYNMTGTNSNQVGASGSVNASYLSSIGRLDLGQSQGRGNGQTTVGVSGGVLVHGGGVTLSQPLGETIALVRAPRAGGVGFEARPGVFTDAAGNTVVPNLTPYRVNRLAIRTDDLGDTVEVKNAALDLVPTRGAVVLAKFDTSVGYRLMMTLTDKNGKLLPFGSKIENEAGQEVGIVGPDGQAFVSGASDAGKLDIKWGRGEKDQCTVPYSLPKDKNPPPIREISGQCE